MQKQKQGKMIILRALCAVLVLCTGLACMAAEAPKTKRAPKLPMRVIVLLDLSDRLKKTPWQAAADKLIIERVVQRFEQQVKANHYIFSRDSLRIAVAPQPSGCDDVILNAKLVIDMASMKGGEKRLKLPQLRKELLESVERIYECAVRETDYVGSDLWGFFNSQLPSLVSEEEKNFLVVLSDGNIAFNREYTVSRPGEGNKYSYMRVNFMRQHPKIFARFHEDGHGLIPVRNKDFKNLKVLLVGVQGTNELDELGRKIIRTYWENWTQAMDIPLQICDNDVNSAWLDPFLNKFFTADNHTDSSSRKGGES